MRQAFQLLLLIVGSSSAAAPVTVASLGLRAIDLPTDKASFYSELVGQGLASSAVRVVSQQDLAAVLGLERQRALLGCSDENSSCVAEMGAALGADVILRGDLARVGNSLRANLKLISADQGRLLASREVLAEDEAAFATRLTQAGRDLAVDLLRAMGRHDEADRVATVERRSTLRTAAWPLLGIGALSAVVGAVLLIVADLDFKTLSTASPIADPTAMGIAQRGPAFETTGGVCLAAGLTLAAAGVLMRIWGHEPAITPSVSPVVGGGALVWKGAW
ncbi:MAG: hypothetical protein IPJ65_13505 [Archangiaceae bacterium]|nr:hypothetical protein [Archangiaceae bacterium]